MRCLTKVKFIRYNVSLEYDGVNDTKYLEWLRFVEY